MIIENREHTVEVFESNVSESEFVRPESVSCEDIKVEIATFRKLAAPNLETQPLFILILY